MKWPTKLKVPSCIYNISNVIIFSLSIIKILWNLFLCFIHSFIYIYPIACFKSSSTSLKTMTSGLTCFKQNLINFQNLSSDTKIAPTFFCLYLRSIVLLAHSSNANMALRESLVFGSLQFFLLEFFLNILRTQACR